MLVTSKGIGPAQLGTSLTVLRKQCVVRDSTVRAEEGRRANAYAISVGEGSAAVILFVGSGTDTIRSVGSDNPFFRTPMGVAVGVPSAN